MVRFLWVNDPIGQVGQDPIFVVGDRPTQKGNLQKEFFFLNPTDMTCGKIEKNTMFYLDFWATIFHH